MPVAYACDDCGTAWPNYREFSKCPRCRTRCRTAMVSSVLTPGEAKIEIRHINFERECRLRDEKRKRLGHPSPEEIGRKEAAELAAKWRAVVVELNGG